MRGTVQSEGLDEYNPFTNASRAAPPSSNYPATIQATTSNQPMGDRSQASELDRRQRELEARARDLEKREQEHAERQKLQQSTQGGAASNWPPLPSFCPCRPCFHQDFDLDFQETTRPMIKTAYYAWLAYVLVLALNVLGALAYFIKSHNDNGQSGTTFGSSILLLVLLTPLSFVCWYRPLYRALRVDSSFSFFTFFIVFSVQIIIVVIQCLGFTWLPSCGWLNGLSMTKQDTVAAFVMLTIAAFFTLIAALDLYLLLKIHAYYRGTGASFQKAKQEFGQGVATEVVRGSTGGGAYSSVP